jgi:hypothetical protein
MVKKIQYISILCVLILIVTFYSPVVFASKTIDNEELLAVKINNCVFGSTKQDVKYFALEEVKELKHILLEYDDAIKENNFVRIARYNSWLKEKGILNEKQIFLLSLLNQYQASSSDYSDSGISESNVMFSAAGNGFMVFPLEKQIIEWIQDQAENQENIIAALVMIILLLVLFYIPSMLITHFIPFRIGMPHSQVVLNSGTMKVGDQNMIPPVKVNLTSFTGITISTPNFTTNNESGDDNTQGFLFIIGIAGEVEEVEI